MCSNKNGLSKKSFADKSKSRGKSVIEIKNRVSTTPLGYQMSSQNSMQVMPSSTGNKYSHVNGRDVSPPERLLHK